jgi:DNA-binding HxlR family transcriptional regulator
VEVLLGVLEGKWSVLVVRELLHGPRRFGELRRALAPVSAKTLTDRLRHLEAAGVVGREAHAEIPPRVTYRLTALGESLRPVLLAMAGWGESNYPLESVSVDDPSRTGRASSYR